MTKRVLGRSGIDVTEEWKSFDLPVVVYSIVDVRISLTDCMTLDTTKVDVLPIGLSLTISMMEKPYTASR
jgi:hypothetical protein